MSEFFAGVDQGSGELAVRQSLESITANIKWVKDHAGQVNAWFEKFLEDNGNKDNNIRRSHVQDFHATYYDEMDKYGRP